MKNVISLAAASLALSVSGAAFAGSSNPPNLGGGSGNASNSSILQVISTFAAPASVQTSIRSAAGAYTMNVGGETLIALDFSDNGQSYTLILNEVDGTVSVVKRKRSGS